MTHPNQESSDRREGRRIPVRIPVRIYQEDTPDKEFKAEITNISEGGAYICSPYSFETGKKILVEIGFQETSQSNGVIIPTEKLEVSLPDPIAETSMIRWEKIEANELQGVGVEFVNLQADKQLFLQRLIRYFESLPKGVEFS